jgi:PAS domain S-box-containing protein
MNDEVARNVVIKDRRRLGLLKADALHDAILNSVGFSSIAIDETGVIQIFNAGAKRMLGYTGAEVVNKLTPLDFSDASETIERARALSLEFATTIAPGFEALVFKAARGIEDQYELTYIRKDGSRLPAVVCVTALHDPKDQIIGYLLIATDNTAQQGLRLMVESVTDCAIVQLDAHGQVLSWNAGAQIIEGYSAREILGQHFSRFYLHEDIERGVPQRDLDAAATTGRCETEGPWARKDGSTYRAKTVLTSFHDETGSLRGFARVTRGLSEAQRLAAPPPVHVAAKPALDKPAPALKRSRLLYVEDHPASLGLLEQLMARRTDVLLLRAANVNLGIDLARTERPDVILLNIDLPGTAAVEFMKRLRADPVTQNTPILALGASAAPDTIVKALEAGFFHYLTKPMKAERFLEALGDALEFTAQERAEENDMSLRKTHSH